MTFQPFSLELYPSKTTTGNNQSDWIYDLTRALTITKSKNYADKIIETVQAWVLNFFSIFFRKLNNLKIKNDNPSIKAKIAQNIKMFLEKRNISSTSIEAFTKRRGCPFITFVTLKSKPHVFELKGNIFRKWFYECYKRHE